MDKGTRIIVSIGSNFNAKENITLAKRKLAFMLGNDTVFTKEMWTDPHRNRIGEVHKLHLFLHDEAYVVTNHESIQATRKTM